jgi:hypothetical protein
MNIDYIVFSKLPISIIVECNLSRGSVQYFLPLYEVEQMLSGFPNRPGIVAVFWGLVDFLGLIHLFDGGGENVAGMFQIMNFRGGFQLKIYYMLS